MPAEKIATVAFPHTLDMRERLIVALDTPTAQAAREIVSRIGDAAGIYKVGLQLFTAEGPALIRELVGSGRRIFLDLKLHDIPNTVGHAVKSAVGLGVHLLTVHAGAGRDVLRAAVDAAGPGLDLLAVTVLTSLNDDDIHETGIPASVSDQVLRLASLAQEAGCAGVVTSPRETAHIRKTLGQKLLIVNPGVRPAGAGKDDQERTATPGEAIRDGASHIVVGRPITKAQDPARAAREIVLEMQRASS